MVKDSIENIVKGVASGDIATVKDEVKATFARTIGLSGVVIISLSVMLFVDFERILPGDATTVRASSSSMPTRRALRHAGATSSSPCDLRCRCML